MLFYHQTRTVVVNFNANSTCEARPQSVSKQGGLVSIELATSVRVQSMAEQYLKRVTACKVSNPELR